MNLPASNTTELSGSNLRHVTILCSDMAGFSEWNQRLGDLEASRIVSRMTALQSIIITRDGAGQVIQSAGDSILAVFDTASAALNRALEIQRVLGSFDEDLPCPRPHLRIGLHMGEVLLKEGERIEIISRHINRARRVMEAAGPGQIMATEGVVEAGKDFIGLPADHLAIQHYGEFYLKGVGATQLCELTDSRLKKPKPPQITEANQSEKALIARLEQAGYRMVGRIGEGASGVVYKAIRIATDQPVAIKVLNPAVCEEPLGRERFIAESSRITQLQLSGVAPVIDERLAQSPPFFVTKLVEGKPIDAALLDAGPRKIASLFKEVCLILDRAHAAGLSHGDLKPANILVRADESPVLLDFGFSLLQEPSKVSHGTSRGLTGTPAYLAPEVILGKKRTPATDVYSLGVVLFKVLARREPFDRESVHQVIQAHLHEDPPLPAVVNPEVSDGLQRICLKALEKNPADRYGSAREMAADLDRVVRGAIVRTRPSVYDNMLFHRASQHMTQIEEWAARGLLNDEEMHGLLSSYESLQRRGIPAVMEGRFYRLWQTAVYLGGWAVINGALLWLIQQWDTLPRLGKLLLGSVPAVTTFALAATMWKFERFRLSFVALVVGVLAVPLLTGVWLHEFKIAAAVPENRLGYELFHTQADASQLTNQQLLLISFVTLVAAGGVMFFTRTTTHSAQTLLALTCFYSACLLWFGLRPDVEDQKWAVLALKYFPLLLLTALMARWLLTGAERSFQAPPWIYFGALLLSAILYGIALNSVKEWTNIDSSHRKATSFLLLSALGAIQVAVGLVARSYLKHRSRLASLAVIIIGLANLLVGLAGSAAERSWPADWWRIALFGQSLPITHVLLPLVSLAIALLACRYQIFAFLLLGLLGFAGSIHFLGYLYFENVSAWPKTLMLLGTLGFFVALYLELRRTRGNAIDDVVSQARL